MKRKLIILSALAIFVSICAAGTLAFFTAETTTHNVITTGGVKIELNEWADSDRTKEFENLTGVMPGRTATKIVEVKNTGNSTAWVRVKIDKKIALEEGAVGEVDPDVVVLDGLNNDNWTYNTEDGYYYYNSPLDAGETTAPIFTGVKFDPQMDNRYQGATVTVDVTAYAVQYANNGETVDKATGWPDVTPETTNP